VLITSPEHPAVHSARDVAGKAVFTFRQGCSYRMRLEAWYAHAHTPMGRVMEIESYQSMLACVIAGAGVALMALSMLDSLPGRDRVRAHRLQAPFDQAVTWLMWRQGMRGANLQAWVDMQQSETINQPSECSVSA